MYKYVQRRSKIKIVGLKLTTVGKTIKQFRIYLRNRIRKGIIPPLDMDGWKILEDEVDAVYLITKENQIIVSLSGYVIYTITKTCKKKKKVLVTLE